MNRPVVAVATVLALLALTHYTDADAIFDYMKAHEEPFDPYPHPPFPQINCDEFEAKLNEMPSKTCPDPIAAGPDAYSNNDIDQRVCVEYRFWYPGHCNMMADYCQRLYERYNLIGMCHKSRRKSHHKSVPYRVCDENGNDENKNWYCPKTSEEHVCSAFMMTYQSMCHMLKHHCENNKNMKNRELAKIISPRTHKDLFDANNKHNNYYDKCGMYNPLLHKNSHFVERFPSLAIVHHGPPEKNLTKQQYEDKVMPTEFKFDHVCRNVGNQSFQIEKERKIDGVDMTRKIHGNSYVLKHLNDDFAQERQHGEAGPRTFDPKTCPGAKDEKTIETILEALKKKDFD